MTERTLIGASEAILALRKAIRTFAPTDMTVLIQGETGTGKELVARALHSESRRAQSRLVAVNCASLPESLVESELFGCEKGAFTGAVSSRLGRFELANGGTLFLDEVGELSLAVQAKLLRVLEEHEIDRLGGHAPVRIDFRLIAATNRDLESLTHDGQFREDLYYRLNVCPIRTPALRERPDDIPALAQHFVSHYRQRTSCTARSISPEVLARFSQHSWPGNVRELQNVVQRAVSLSTSETVQIEDLPFEFFRKMLVSRVRSGEYHKAMHDLSRQLCVCALTAARGNCGGAARLLGLNRTTFYRVARRHNLDLSEA